MINSVSNSSSLGVSIGNVVHYRGSDGNFYALYAPKSSEDVEDIEKKLKAEQTKNNVQLVVQGGKVIWRLEPLNSSCASRGAPNTVRNGDHSATTHQRNLSAAVQSSSKQGREVSKTPSQSRATRLAMVIGSLILIGSVTGLSAFGMFALIAHGHIAFGSGLALGLLGVSGAASFVAAAMLLHNACKHKVWKPECRKTGQEIVKKPLQVTAGGVGFGLGVIGLIFMIGGACMGLDCSVVTPWGGESRGRSGSDD